jgi:hypothetical protein
MRKTVPVLWRLKTQVLGLEEQMFQLLDTNLG